MPPTKPRPTPSFLRVALVLGLTLAAFFLVTSRPFTLDALGREQLANRPVGAVAQTAPHDTPEGEALLYDLFSKVIFRGAGVWESLIATVTAAYCWDFAPDLRKLPNPWLPLLEHFGMGYATSGDAGTYGNGLTLLVGYWNGVRSYRIV